MKDFADMKSMDDLDFSKHASTLTRWVKKYWDWKNFKPNGYDEYLKTYEDFKDMENIPEPVEKFKGSDNSRATSFNFPTQISIPHIAYDDTCQGRKPLEMFIGAVMGYGIAYGEKLAELKMKDSPEIIEGRFMRLPDKD